MSTLLEVSQLAAAYGESQVLFDIDLTIREGEVATLLGRNGMGKTSTVRALCGMLPVHGGTIRFAGAEIVDPETYEGFGAMVDTMVELRKGKMTAEECAALLKKSNYFGTMLHITSSFHCSRNLIVKLQR